MKDIYVLQMKTQHGGTIICIADDFDRASMEQAKYPASVQAMLEPVQNFNLLEEGD